MQYNIAAKREVEKQAAPQTRAWKEWHAGGQIEWRFTIAYGDQTVFVPRLVETDSDFREEALETASEPVNIKVVMQIAI